MSHVHYQTLPAIWEFERLLDYITADPELMVKMGRQILTERRQNNDIEDLL